MYQPKLDTYINISPLSASCIPKPSNSFPLPFATNIPYPFHISLNPQFPTQFSRHIPSNPFVQSFHISFAFHNRPFDLFCLSCHIIILYNWIKVILINKTPAAIHSDSGHAKCHYVMWTHKALTTVGQKECIIYFITFNLMSQIFKEISTLTVLLFH
jgi:hypothetical protein